ncbi:prolipoprotein diacylglyceryl transferase [bacterium]|nr:prolipoprotein diacylglyceryl transferase [bacterium]
MYPTLYHAFKDLFGVELTFLQIVMTFGFFVALAFLGANWIMTIELKRKEEEGIIGSFQKEVKPPSIWSEYLGSLIIGFLVGFKLGYMITNFGEVSADPQGFLISGTGSWLWGAIVAAGSVALKYYNLQKVDLNAGPSLVEFHPYQMMGNMTIIAAISGFIGAKLFHHLENWSEFIQDPVAALMEPFSGLTFFGGLIFGAAAVLWYANKHGVKWRTMLDVGAPAMMLAYGIGRMGCHFSGDGDWGIVNVSDKPSWLSWLPDWAWAYNYPNNVLGITLEQPVWPTPMYEVIMALSLFAVLWVIRKKVNYAGVLFCIYLIFSGIERYIIEKIRVNPEFFMGFTQAEIISMLFVLTGLVGIWYFRKNPMYPKNQQE